MQIQPAAPAPHPRLLPEEVIELQLAALRRNDEPTPDAGIATAFEFASPGNRAFTGPLERFIALVKSPHYAPMLNHRAATFGPLDIEGDFATQQVMLLDASGESAIYGFELSRQTDGPYQGCWMTDSVLRL